MDQRVDGVAKLLQQGMRLFLDNKTETDRKINALIDAQVRTESRFEQLAGSQQRLEESHRRLEEAHQRLADAQAATERSLRAFLDSLREGKNGH